MIKRAFRVVVALALFLCSAILAYKHNTRIAASTHEEVAANKGSSKEETRELGPISLLNEIPDSVLPFSHGLRSKKEIALSFDACPTGGKNHFNETIANTLMQTKTPATIFLSGMWVLEDTVATHLLASNSLFELENHSFTHPHLIRMTEAGIRRELERTQKIVTRLTGQTPFLFRPPFGEYNDTLITVARDLGLLTVQFDVESGDPDTTFTAERLIKSVTKNARNGSIVIMHINNRGWHTAEALPTIISDLRARGFQLVKVSDLMRDISPAASSDNLTRSASN